MHPTTKRGHRSNTYSNQYNCRSAQRGKDSYIRLLSCAETKRGCVKTERPRYWTAWPTQQNGSAAPKNES